MAKKTGLSKRIPTPDMCLVSKGGPFAGVWQNDIIFVECGVELPNLNHQDNNGDTPLHLAVKNQNFEIIKFLVEHGADLSIKNEQNQTPDELAAQLENNKITNFLKQF